MASNGIAGIGQFAQGKESPVVRGAQTVLTGKNYFGQPISNQGIFGNNKKSKPLNPLQKTGNYVTGVAQSIAPVPFGMQGVGNLASEGTKNFKGNS